MHRFSNIQWMHLISLMADCESMQIACWLHLATFNFEWYVNINFLCSRSHGLRAFTAYIYVICNAWDYRTGSAWLWSWTRLPRRYKSHRSECILDYVYLYDALTISTLALLACMNCIFFRLCILDIIPDYSTVSASYITLQLGKIIIGVILEKNSQQVFLHNILSQVQIELLQVIRYYIYNFL